MKPMNSFQKRARQIALPGTPILTEDTIRVPEAPIPAPMPASLQEPGRSSTKEIFRPPRRCWTPCPPEMRSGIFLYGIIYLRQGWYDKANEYLTIAYQQEPGNAEYANAYNTLRHTGNPYSRAAGRGGI